jgi:hypothetical protein
VRGRGAGARGTRRRSASGRLGVGRRRGVCCQRSARGCWEARRERQRQRERLPEDAMLRELRPGVGGECRWCGEPVYRRDPAGYVRVDRRSWWHRGRVVHPDAEPEPDCLGEYLAQAFTFREQVRRRDRGLCAACGRDCERCGLGRGSCRGVGGRRRAFAGECADVVQAVSRGEDGA